MSLKCKITYDIIISCYNEMEYQNLVTKYNES